MVDRSPWGTASYPLPVPNPETGEVNCPVGAVVRQHIGGYIYRYRQRVGQERMAYYWPTNPRTHKQQNWRYIFADGIAAWHALTPEERTEWERQAKKHGMVSQHYFQSVWMSTHPNVGKPWRIGYSRLGSLDYIP